MLNCDVIQNAYPHKHRTLSRKHKHPSLLWILVVQSVMCRRASYCPKTLSRNPLPGSYLCTLWFRSRPSVGRNWHELQYTNRKPTIANSPSGPCATQSPRSPAHNGVATASGSLVAALQTPQCHILARYQRPRDCSNVALASWHCRWRIHGRWGASRESKTPNQSPPCPGAY